MTDTELQPDPAACAALRQLAVPLVPMPPAEPEADQ